MENFKVFDQKLNTFINSFNIEDQIKSQHYQIYGLGLLQCNKFFQGRYLRSLITSKKKIVEVIQNYLGKFQNSRKSALKHYLKQLTTQAQKLLNEGIFTIHLGLAELTKKIQEKEQSKQNLQFMQLLKQLMKSLNPLLRYFFVNKQYLKRTNSLSSYMLTSHNKIYTQKKIQIEVKEKNRRKSKRLNINKNASINVQFNFENFQVKSQQILNQIQEQFSLLNTSELIQRYLKQQQDKIIDSTQICRICQKKIKLKQFKAHIINCSKKAKIETDLNQLQQRKKFLYQQVLKLEKNIIINKGQLSPKQKNKLKIISLLKDLYNEPKKSERLRRNTLLHNVDVKKQCLQVIKQELWLFQQKYQKDELLSQFITNKQQIISARKRLSIVEINEITQRRSRNKGSDVQSLKSLQNSINNAQSITKGFKTKKSLFASKKQTGKKGSKFHLKNQSSDSNSNSYSSQKSSSNSFSKKNSNNSSEISFQPKISLRCSNKLKRKVALHMVEITNEKEDKQCTQQERRNSLFQQKIGVLSKKKSTQIRNQLPVIQFSTKSMKNISMQYSQQSQKMTLQDFQVLKFLGKGAFGKVYLVRRRTTRDLYAIKHIMLQQNQNSAQMELIKKQHQIFKKIAGNHLIRAPFAFSQDYGHFFVLQFMPGGDLSQILAQQVYLQESHAKFYLAQIILALQHLHNCQIIHRDLKPQNIVIDKNGHIKLTDFGLSDIKIQDKLIKAKQKFCIKKQNTERANRRVALVNKRDIAKIIGTPDYIAPQIINQTSINNKSIDWWSLGVMAYEMLVGCRPFSAMSVDQVLKNIIQCKIQWPQIGYQDQMMSPQAQDLISKLLDKNFKKRLGSQNIAQIKNHSFFKQIDWENVKNQKPPLIPKKLAKTNFLNTLNLLGQDIQLKKQIKNSKNKSMNTICQKSKQILKQSNFKSKIKKSTSGLQNFVRYDFLLQQTYESVEERMKRQKDKIQKIKTIGSFVQDQEKQNLNNAGKYQNIDFQSYYKTYKSNLKNKNVKQQINQLNNIQQSEQKKQVKARVSQNKNVSFRLADFVTSQQKQI